MEIREALYSSGTLASRLLARSHFRFLGSAVLIEESQRHGAQQRVGRAFERGVLVPEEIGPGLEHQLRASSTRGSGASAPEGGQARSAADAALLFDDGWACRRRKCPVGACRRRLFVGIRTEVVVGQAFPLVTGLQPWDCRSIAKASKFESFARPGRGSYRRPVRRWRPE
jgi:hypothetical protein